MNVATSTFAALAILFAFPVSAAPEAASQDAEKEKKVRRLLEVTGSAAMGKQVLDSMMDQFAKLPNLPEGFVEKFKEVADAKELIEMLVPIYLKHMDAETLDAAIAFYESPAGKKFVKSQPAIMTESMEAGQKWGETLARKALKALEK